MSSEDSFIMRQIFEKWFASSTNNFDQIITNSLDTVVKVPGENDIAPERLEVFSGGDRIFLEYGTDSRYNDTEAGRELIPGSDEEVMTNPGGFQLGRIKRGSSAGQGNSFTIESSGVEANRRLPDGRWALFLVDADTTGVYELEVQTGENT